MVLALFFDSFIFSILILLKELLSTSNLHFQTFPLNYCGDYIENSFWTNTTTFSIFPTPFAFEKSWKQFKKFHWFLRQSVELGPSKNCPIGSTGASSAGERQGLISDLGLKTWSINTFPVRHRYENKFELFLVYC